MLHLLHGFDINYFYKSSESIIFFYGSKAGESMPFNLPDNGILKPKVVISALPESERENARKDYLFRVKETESRYVSELPKTEDIYNRNCFSGLLRTIAIDCGIPDFNDQRLFSMLYDYYSIVCARYCQSVTVSRFALMLGVTKYHLIEWEDRNSSPLWRVTMIKRLKTESESNAIDGALTGNPGFIFLLKAKYGYNDQPQSGSQTGNEQSTLSLEQIARQIGIETSADTLPDDTMQALPGDILDV